MYPVVLTARSDEMSAPANKTWKVSDTQDAGKVPLSRCTRWDTSTGRQRTRVP
ncbi:hypothetical protein J6590_002462 [Homalodisca vitripennis]|nr:hypothetical protein J6590_002462 [Homalodisca vitripennis]